MARKTGNDVQEYRDSRDSRKKSKTKGPSYGKSEGGDSKGGNQQGFQAITQRGNDNSKGVSTGLGRGRAEQGVRQPIGSTGATASQQKQCYNCGSTDHLLRECPNPRKTFRCFSCDEVGHMAAQCPLKQTSAASSVGSVQGGRGRGVGASTASGRAFALIHQPAQSTPNEATGGRADTCPSTWLSGRGVTVPSPKKRRLNHPSDEVTLGCVGECSGPADMAALEEMAEVMLRHKFQKQNPALFRGGPDPKLAEHWLSQMEEILNSMSITDDQTRVSLAASQLEENAVLWWHLIDRTLTWQEFRDLFINKYFPPLFQHALENDFLQLVQRGITVIEYEAEFSELARYAHQLVPDEESRIRRFLKGLKVQLRRRVSLVDLHSYSEAVRRALAAEEELDNEKSSQRERRQRDPYQRSCNHRGQQGRDKSGCPQRAARTSPESWRQKTCYGCGEPGHLKNECTEWRKTRL